MCLLAQELLTCLYICLYIVSFSSFLKDCVKRANVVITRNSRVLQWYSLPCNFTIEFLEAMQIHPINCVKENIC